MCVNINLKFIKLYQLRFSVTINNFSQFIHTVDYQSATWKRERRRRKNDSKTLMDVLVASCNHIEHHKIGNSDHTLYAQGQITLAVTAYDHSNHMIKRTVTTSKDKTS